MKFAITRSDGVQKGYSHNWVRQCIKQSAGKILFPMSNEEIEKAELIVFREAKKKNKPVLDYEEFRDCIRIGLADYPEVANAYLRTHKKTMAEDFSTLCDQINTIMVSGDKDSGTIDSSLVSTQRTLIMSQLEKITYKQYILTPEEEAAFDEGYIYIHDMGARKDTVNCGLFDMEAVLKGGFEMGDIWYEEPRTLAEAFDVMGSVIINSAAQLYGGFTVSQVDNLLAYYAEKSFRLYEARYLSIGLDEERSRGEAFADLEKDYDAGFISLERRLNTVISPRGDYPFVTVTVGICKDRFAEMAVEAAIRVRKNGHGKDGFHRPVLFPKLVFLFDHNLHGEGGRLNHLFEMALDCSQHVMYPEFLSLTGKGYVAQMYKQYGKVISPMCCRAFLSPWYERGGMTPADENDVPVFVGRFNIGVVSLNLPMILQKSIVESRDFREVLDGYLEMIRGIHKRTYQFLSRKKAKTNPMCFCQGGFLGGTLQPDEVIAPLLKSATASFGITALNELEQLYHQKSLVEDGSFALEAVQYIHERITAFSEEDQILYTVYGTPAESLCGRQARQFKAKYGIIPNVSDREYVSNSFHCHVSEDITPIEKQVYESRFWDYFNGGKIQYIRLTNPQNKDALRAFVLNAMELGLYEGINISRTYCNDCGKESNDVEVCPFCGSDRLTRIERMCGFISYTNLRGESRLNAAKMAEIKDRKSM